jgi:hypothetical protein
LPRLVAICYLTCSVVYSTSPVARALLLIRTLPLQNDCYFAVGVGQKELYQTWFITTPITDSINLDVETDKLKTKNLKMKTVTEAVNKGQLADDTHYHYKYSNSNSFVILHPV